MPDSLNFWKLAGNLQDIGRKIGQKFAAKLPKIGWNFAGNWSEIEWMDAGKLARNRRKLSGGGTNWCLTAICAQIQPKF